ncbi:hypothetical protein D9758_003720 [Tetrapyrgos nigripes]|uniref:Uncharacterized protein n=1 Tax=Tetrapyrgos nigripes TaxID=182062 RepID=A0A8H5GM42_9AGAR|nr:hypothetical protein D9758_003720 [Tetrapyrgos nigripes]
MLSLHRLEVDSESDHPISSAECMRLFGLIGGLPQITKLDLCYEEVNLGFNDIRPLLQAKTLSHLYLGLVTVSITNVELSFIGHSLPCLESFSLHLSPEEVPTLRGLTDLAKHALKLWHLNIFISPVFHPSASNDRIPNGLKLDTLAHFQCLEYLNIGQSHLDTKWSSVVICVLDQILPLGCDFGFWKTPEADEVVHRSDEEWGKVAFSLHHRGVLEVPLPQDGSL